MSRRSGLYGLWCVVNSSVAVGQGSVSIAKESLKQWITNSGLTRPVLKRYQWFYDPQWEAAKALSQTSRRLGAYKDIKGKKLGVRSYSTEAVRKAEEVLESEKKPEMTSSEIPTSRISRLFHYSSLAANVGANIAAQGIAQVAKGESPTWRSLLLSESNIDKITKKFSKMRGAALKIGQMMSFQDDKVLPKELYEILSKVQNSANYMPHRQLERVLVKELGADWKDNFRSFEMTPIAAASIGQVHAAVLKTGEKAVVKVQYPGVKESIDSDLNNMLMLLTASRLMPKGLFLDRTVDNARRELKWECDYLREAKAMKIFGELVKDDPVFDVPVVYPKLSTDKVLTMERMDGTEIMKLSPDTPQHTKDLIGENIMRLCLMEIASFEYMQTDPNWANFLYNEKTKRIQLLDFGAARPFADKFIQSYRNLLIHAKNQNYEKVKEISTQLGFLNGLESKSMTDAHVQSMIVLCEVFRGPSSKAFSFTDQTVSDRIRDNIGLMLEERLCPPPDETYSLHRKFSGVFLLCTRLGANVHCAKLFNEIFVGHEPKN